MSPKKVHSFAEILNDQQKMVLEMSHLNWPVEKKLSMLEARGYKIGKRQYHKQVRVIKDLRTERLDYYAKNGLAETNLDLYDKMVILQDQLWSKIYTETDNRILVRLHKELRETILWTSSFADAMQDTREKENLARRSYNDSKEAKFIPAIPTGA